MIITFRSFYKATTPSITTLPCIEISIFM
jgi:hypothetical protein